MLPICSKFFELEITSRLLAEVGRASAKTSPTTPSRYRDRSALPCPLPCTPWLLVSQVGMLRRTSLPVDDGRTSVHRHNDCYRSLNSSTNVQTRSSAGFS